MDTLFKRRSVSRLAQGRPAGASQNPRKESYPARAEVKDMGSLPKIRIGYRVGSLTVEKATEERKNGYTVWRCRCNCGGEILLDTRCLQRGTVTDCGCETRVKPGQRDITGERFGKLIALYPTGKRGHGGSIIWHCQCDCGGEVDAPLHQLSAGYRKSCGCLSHPPLKDYIGKRFGDLTVLEYAGKQNGMHQWLCQCDCGKKTVVGQTPLQNGKRTDCGCKSNRLYRRALIKNNDCGEMQYVEGVTGKVFGRLTVLEFVGFREKRSFWRCRCECGQEAVVQYSNLISGHTKSCGCLQRTMWKENLKLIDGTSVTLLESMKNRTIASNTSGYTGVYRQTKSGKWAAQITFKGKTYYLGAYDKIEDAVKARKRGEEMHDDFLEWYRNQKDADAAPDRTMTEHVEVESE